MIWVIVIAIAAAAGWLLGLAQGGNRAVDADGIAELWSRAKTKTNRELEATIRALENQLSMLANHAAQLEGFKPLKFPNLPERVESKPLSGSAPVDGPGPPTPKGIEQMRESDPLKHML